MKYTDARRLIRNYNKRSLIRKGTRVALALDPYKTGTCVRSRGRVKYIKWDGEEQIRTHNALGLLKLYANGDMKLGY